MFAAQRVFLSATMIAIAGVGSWCDQPADSFPPGAPSADDSAATDFGSGDGQPGALGKHDDADYRLELKSGQIMDVGAVFRELGTSFEQSMRGKMRQAKSPLVRVNHPSGSQPLLLASRRGKVLHGPFASFAEDGAPVAYISYRKGERDSALLTWDETNRPLLFAQYKSGELDGIRCLFQVCSDECKSGHIWMVQQWTAGQLHAAHLVAEDGEVDSFDYHRGQAAGPTTPELDAATTKLGKLEERIDADEGRLKQLIARYYEQERAASYARLQFEIARRNYMFRAPAYARCMPARSGRVVM